MRLARCDYHYWPWLIEAVDQTQRPLDGFTRGLKCNQDSITGVKVRSEPLDITNVETHLHLVRPIDSDAVTQFELDYTGKRCVRIVNQL